MRDSVTFIHAADLHLDAPFQGISAEDDRVGRELAEGTYVAWKRIVDLALSRGVDFVLIAGDVYNAAERSLRAQLRFREQVLRLTEAGIPLLMVHGNHDPLSGWSSGAALPDGVFVFGSSETQRFEVLSQDGFVCAVYGRSFQQSAERSDFTPGYRRSEDDTVAIGLLHCNVGDNPDYDPYAPCSLEGLRAGRMDYWALGHIHKFEVLSKDPYAVYAGSPQGLNPKETGAHGCCVVEVTRTGAVSLEHVALAPVTWAIEVIDASEAECIDDVRRLITSTCDRLRADSAAAVVARFTLAGRSVAHSELIRPGYLRELLEDTRAEQVAAAPWVWIDRLTDETAAPVDLDALRCAPDFTADLVRAADELAADPDALAALLGTVAAPVMSTLPGYEPAAPETLLHRARDLALDLLLERAGDGR